MGEMSHLVSLSVGVNSPEQWDHVHGRFVELQKEWGPDYSGVTVSSYLTDSEEDGVEEKTEYYDENTLNKVKEALAGVLRSFDLEHPQLIDSFVNEMLNAGILFRERR
jgi:hypothetical protein